ncbi:unnamed protein product [Calypogeia fissa]
MNFSYCALRAPDKAVMVLQVQVVSLVHYVTTLCLPFDPGREMKFMVESHAPGFAWSVRLICTGGAACCMENANTVPRINPSSQIFHLR